MEEFGMRRITVVMDIEAACPGCGARLGEDVEDGQHHDVKDMVTRGHHQLRVTCPGCYRLVAVTVSTGAVLEVERAVVLGG
jgi:ribosomal protein S27E